jgi:hypothetical protein
VLLLLSCGYRFTTVGGALPEGVRTVRAPVFDNRTSEPAAEALFTTAFREQLVRAGKLGDDDAEAVVEGALETVGSSPILASPGKLPTWRLSATVALKLTRGGRVLAEARVTGAEDYLAGADLLLTEANRQAALGRLAETTMREGYERLASR